MNTRKTIAALAGILVAVIVVGALIIFLVPSSPETTTPPDSKSTTSSSGDAVRFNTSVLQRSDYLQLDQQPIREGAIPVQPPAQVGKANPFI